MLAQGAIIKNLILLPKEVFQFELINVFKNAYKCFNNGDGKIIKKSWNLVLKIVWEPCQR